MFILLVELDLYTLIIITMVLLMFCLFYYFRLCKWHGKRGLPIGTNVLPKKKENRMPLGGPYCFVPLCKNPT